MIDLRKKALKKLHKRREKAAVKIIEIKLRQIAKSKEVLLAVEQEYEDFLVKYESGKSYREAHLSLNSTIVMEKAFD